MIEMAANGTTTTTTRARTNTTGHQTTAGRTDTARIREGLTKVRNGSVSYARHSAERSVDVPVGAALTVADRVTEIVELFRTRESANRELNTIQTRVQRELNRFERRGAGARRRARTRVRRTRNRFTRELRQRRRRVETTMKQNRARAEGGLKRAQERVTALV
jgi:hypothetical protein